MKRDLTRPLLAVGVASVSVSSSSRARTLALSPIKSVLGRCLLRPAVPVVSGWNPGLDGVLLMIPLMDTGSTEGAVMGPDWKEPGGALGPVGRRELEKVVCSTSSLRRVYQWMNIKHGSQ